MKDCTTCKYGFVDEQLGFPMCHHPSRFSEDCVDFNMHEDKEEPKKATGIEEKKLPDGLEEAAEEHAGLNFDRQMEYKSFWNDVDTFIAGAEWRYQKDRREFAKLKAKEWSDVMEWAKNWLAFKRSGVVIDDGFSYAMEELIKKLNEM